MDRLEFPFLGDASSHVIDDLAEGGPHRHFHQTGVLDLAHEAEDLRALAVLGSHAGVPVGPLEHDHRDIRIGLDIVEVGGAFPEALFHGVNILGSGPSDLPLQRSHQGGGLSADKGARPG